MSSRQYDRPHLNKEEQLMTIVRASQRLLAAAEEAPDIEELCAIMADISGARYVVFNSFCGEQNSFTTQALWGPAEDWEHAAVMLGLDRLSGPWPADPDKTELLKSHQILVFRHLDELLTTSSDPDLLRSLQGRFRIDALVIVRVQSGNEVIGDFTLFMSQGAELPTEDILTMYANQVGLYLAKVEVETRWKDSNALLYQIVDATKAGTWEWCIKTGQTFVNQRWANLMGYTLEELQPVTMDIWEQRLHPDDRSLAEERLREVLRGEVDHYRAELRIRHRDGHYIWILDQGKIVKRASNGDALVMLGAQFDINESKRLTDAMRQSQEHYRVLVESSYDIIYRLDLHGTFTYLSQAWTELLGHGVEEALGQSFRPYVHPDDLDSVENMFDKVRQTEVRQKLSGYRLRHKDGSWHHYTTNSVPVWDGANQVIGFTGTARDITDLTQLHQELMEQKDEIERFFEVSLDLLCITDTQGRFLRLNKTWSTTLGFSLEELEQFHALDLVHPDDVEPTRAAFRQLADDQAVYQFVNRYRCRDGQYRYLEWRSAPYEGKIYGFARDITAQKEQQQEVEYLSLHDHLTGLYNRRYMTDSMARLDTSRNFPFSIIAIDINGLKLTNDAFGHAAGDRLLVEAAEILRSACRVDDIICRVGGDEFMILLPHADKATASAVKQRIVTAAQESNLDETGISMAVGFATKIKAEEDIFEIQKQADTAMYRDKLRSGKAMRDQFMGAMLETVRSRYDKEQRHTERVAEYCGELAMALGLDESEIAAAKLAGALHDIGKVTVPSAALNKLGPLTQQEWEDVRRHPVTGYHILKGIEGYAHIAESVLYHHERPDGKGYPEKRVGKTTPLLSRIIGVADAYEAMTADRTYRPTFTAEKARTELAKGAGTQFDREIVEAMLNKVLV